MAMAEAMVPRAIGRKTVEARVRQLSTAPRRAEGHTGVKMWTSEIKVRRRPHAVLRARSDGERGQGDLDYNRVWIRTMTTSNLNGVRAATHIYNMPDEVDRLLDAVTRGEEPVTLHDDTTAGARGQGPGN
jgi:selenocysteine lyase/cysteine desulfurase